MYCKDCKFREKSRGHGTGMRHVCGNRSAMAEYLFQEDTSKMMIYPYNDGGSFYVGDNFGCVHFREQLEVM